jgi:hypothetical protein
MLPASSTVARANVLNRDSDAACAFVRALMCVYLHRSHSSGQSLGGGRV